MDLWLDKIRTSLGERAGGDLLDRLAAVRRECAGLRLQTWRLAAGAVWTVASGLAAVAAVLALVVPELGPIFRASGLRITSASSAVLNVAEIGRPFWLVVAVALLAAGLTPWILRRRAHRWLRRAPWLGTTWRGIDDAEWTGLLALLLEAGTNLPQALRLADDIVTSGDPAGRGTRWAARLEPGEGWPEIIRNEAGLSAPWRQLLAADSSPQAPAAALKQLAAMSAGLTRQRLTWLRAVIWPAVWLAGALLVLALSGSIGEPVLAYLRSWA